jgi:two-component system sensor histidine kinase RegB
MTPFFLSALKQNLRRLCWIRCILLAVECMALVYAYATDLPVPFALIGNLLLLALAIILFGFWRTSPNRPWPVMEMEFLLHLLVDAVVLCLLLYLTGGASNPLVSLLLIPLTISAAVLSARYTRVITAFSLASYSALLYYFIPLELLSTHHAPTGISPHIAGMWFTFLLSALLITYFITQMAHTLRQQERHLQRNREDTLRDEQVLAVATLAAGAAHDLGTPLSTMRVLLSEMEIDTAADKALNDDIKLLGTQVERCKNSLQSLVNTAQGQAEIESLPISTESFLSQLLESWRSVCPQVKINTRLADDVRDTALRNTPSLSQALMNLLNNAAQVSEVIDVEACRHNSTLQISIRDYGPGIPAELLNQIGHSMLSQSENGLGLGLFLTHATIERIGGSIALDNHPDGGTLTLVSIPLERAASHD